MSQEDKIKIIGELLLMRISNDSKLEAVKSILLGNEKIGFGELPGNIEFMGEDKDGNGIYKIS